MIPLILFMCKNKSGSGQAKDKYSFFAFLFLLLTLGIRTVTLIPIILDHEHLLPDNDADCMEYVFGVTPLQLFTIAAMIQTARWFKIKKRLITGSSYEKWYDWVNFIFVSFYLITLPVGYTIYCSAHRITRPEQVYSIFTFGIYLVVHVLLILANLFFIISFKLTLRKDFPILNKKIS